jgi:ferrochelatase
MPAEAPFGVVCMAYGTPRREADILPYLRHIRGGLEPSPSALEDLVRRYRAIGGSPLDRITEAQAAALGKRLGVPAFVGMKHAPPFIAEAAARAQEAGVERLIGLPLAPHYAEMSVGAYEQALRSAWRGPLLCVPGFHDHPAFVAAVRDLIFEALAAFDADLLIFTAHSLPERIAAAGDDYPGRLYESCRLVAQGVELPPCRVAFQSASSTGEPWFGPDLLEVIAATSARRVLVCPIGFVADHLEILYDVDIAARDAAAAQGIELRRTESFNDRAAFIDALAAVIGDASREWTFSDAVAR